MARRAPRTPWQRLAVAFAAVAAALLLAHAALRWTWHPWLLASFGGSCVILLGMPRGIMAQPRSFFGGHLLSTAVGLLMHDAARWLGGPVENWAAAAVGAALVAMMLTRTIHSPAGANPIVVFAEDAPWSFLLAPLLVGLCILFAVAMAANNLPRPWGAGPWPRFRGRRTRNSGRKPGTA